MVHLVLVPLTDPFPDGDRDGEDDHWGQLDVVNENDVLEVRTDLDRVLVEASLDHHGAVVLDVVHDGYPLKDDAQDVLVVMVLLDDQRALNRASDFDVHQEGDETWHRDDEGEYCVHQEVRREVVLVADDPFDQDDHHLQWNAAVAAVDQT